MNKEELIQNAINDFENLIATQIIQSSDSETLKDFRHYHPQAEWKDVLTDTLKELISSYANRHGLKKSFLLKAAKVKAAQTEGNAKQLVIEILNSF